ncbi:hypothetical protein GCM10020255_008670 [Rhodococcus baikonurensis]
MLRTIPHDAPTDSTTTPRCGRYVTTNPTEPVTTSTKSLASNASPTRDRGTPTRLGDEKKASPGTTLPSTTKTDAELSKVPNSSKNKKWRCSECSHVIKSGALLKRCPLCKEMATSRRRGDSMTRRVFISYQHADQMKRAVST